MAHPYFLGEKAPISHEAGMLDCGVRYSFSQPRNYGDIFLKRDTKIYP